jgi:thiosulfate/3-mercaptopyruvate sulfurtransferase
MPYTTLVDTATLAGFVGNPDVAIVDCRFDLHAPAWGEQAYLEGHIPGAVYADLDRDLTGPKTGGNGRHPLPDPSALVAAVGRLGIDDGVQVVAYDQDSGMFASRLWWLLRWLGHDAVAVLDGGFAKWLAEGRDTVNGHERRSARTFNGVPRGAMTASASDVAAALHTSGARLLDARAPERYRGDVEPLDPVAGHIPGAANHFFQQNLSQGVFRPARELRVAFESSLAGVPPDQAICYCGSGVTACHNLLAMEHAGLRGARLYPGSWSEWVADPSRPIERG